MRSPVSLFALAASLCLTPGCTFDTSGLALATNRYQCAVNINEYGIGNPMPTMTVVKGGDYPDAWAWRRFEISTTHVELPLYVDDRHVPYEIPTKLAGSYLLQVDSRDRTNTLGSNFIVAIVGSDVVDRFWVAFDTTATTVPTWLGERFTPATGVPPIRSTANQTTYALWRPTNPADWSTIIALGGNNASGVVWKNGKVGQQYLLLVRLKPSVTPVYLRTLGTIRVGLDCSSFPPAADLILSGAQGQLERWLGIQGNEKYRTAIEDGSVKLEVDPSACALVCWWAAGEYTCVRSVLEDEPPPGTPGRPEAIQDALVVNAWPRSSEGMVDPSQSWAMVTLVETGQSSFTSLVGQVDFHINQSSDAELGAVDVVAADVTLGDGTRITDISVAHNQEFLAACTEALPPGPYRLCDSYSVAPGEFVASGVCEVDDQTLPLVLVNDVDMALAIDFNARMFALFGGPLSATFDAGSGPLNVQMWVYIAGSFLNFAPVASSQETPKYWECADSNMVYVHLYGSSSFDGDGHSDIVDWLWLDDTGELSQTVLGTTQNIALMMGFGTHHVSLVATDSQGVASTESFDLVVGDSQIDYALFPDDRWVIRQDEYGAIVDPGAGVGADDCSGTVQFTNDAPANHHFHIGYTPVTWTADDLRGNVEVHIQRIFVLEPEYYPPPLVTLTADHAVVGITDSLQVDMHIEGQGNTLLLDEYVLLETPGGIFSFTGRWWVPGVQPKVTSGQYAGAAIDEEVYHGVLYEEFPGQGVYRFSAVLVKSAGSPLVGSDTVARDDAEVTVMVESMIFEDGFESGDTSYWSQ